jgi:hypothetical protein
MNISYLNILENWLKEYTHTITLLFNTVITLTAIFGFAFTIKQINLMRLNSILENRPYVHITKNDVGSGLEVELGKPDYLNIKLGLVNKGKVIAEGVSLRIKDAYFVDKTFFEKYRIDGSQLTDLPEGIAFPEENRLKVIEVKQGSGNCIYPGDTVLYPGVATVYRAGLLKEIMDNPRAKVLITSVQLTYTSHYRNIKDNYGYSLKHIYYFEPTSGDRIPLIRRMSSNMKLLEQ